MEYAYPSCPTHPRCTGNGPDMCETSTDSIHHILHALFLNLKLHSTVSVAHCAHAQIISTTLEGTPEKWTTPDHGRVQSWGRYRYALWQIWANRWT